MTATMQPLPRLGEGLYSVTEAARLLTQGDRAVPPAKVRRWLDTALSFGRCDLGDGGAGLSFHDLVSLELVARFRQRGVSLQRVHRLETQLQQQYPQMNRPFAWQVFFTDGTSVWAGLDGDPSLVEIVGKRPGHYAWTGAIASFATEVDYAASGEATVWRRAKGVELDATRQHGQPRRWRTGTASPRSRWPMREQLHVLLRTSFPGHLGTNQLPQFGFASVLGEEQQTVEDGLNSSGGLRSGLGEDDLPEEVLGSKDLVHEASHEVDVLVAYLDEDAAGLGQQLPRYQQVVSQVAQVGVDAQLPGVAAATCGCCWPRPTPTWPWAPTS